jgi:UPF0176 protein
VKATESTAVVTRIANVAAYRFVPLTDLPALRDRLHQRALSAGLKGTVLVAEEGINFSLAGEPVALQGWLDALQTDPRLAAMPLRRSESGAMPFARLKVKIKPEIIRMNQPTVRPALSRAAAVDAPTLARWLQAGRCDAGRELVLLDTRNGFEVDAGAFEGALDWRLQSFGDFPEALAANAEALAGKTVVSYCTGGIRCEKAALWMQQQGLEHTLQLDGGILGYFAAMPGAPGWHGRCFVFDEREGLDAEFQAAA